MASIITVKSFEFFRTSIKEASMVTGNRFTEEVECYVVNLLINPPPLEFVTENYLSSQDKSSSEKAKSLRNIGDVSLLISGVFPKIADKRNVGVDFYVGLGSTSYQSVGCILGSYDKRLKTLYESLSSQFVQIQTTLSSLSF
jgi:hypothetical protein